MNISIVINTYIDVNKKLSNPYDHPTNLERFETENTLQATMDSIKKLKTEQGDNIRIILFGIATQENTAFDNEIREKMKVCADRIPFEVLVYTNSDILVVNEKLNSEFLSVKGYPEIRTLGFIFPVVLGDDIIIQIDDDELMRPEYLVKTKELLKNNPDKYLFTAPYEKNGTVRIKTEDTLKSWKKFAKMAEDMEDFYFKAGTVKETLFGFGGNMIVRKEFAEQIFYPLNVPRGEDFSMLLAARLIYESGNPYAEIKENNKIFKAYFAPYEEITIIHKPPHEPRTDFLRYFENNMKRFVMEWGAFSKQDKLTIKKLRELSKYIAEMIGHEDIESYIQNAAEEMKQIFDKEKVELIYEQLINDVKYYQSIDRFENYKIRQKSYIEFIKSISNEFWKNKILSLGR